MSLSTSILTVSLFSCLQKHTQAHADSVYQPTSETLCTPQWSQGPRANLQGYMLSREVWTKDALKSAPLFFTVSPTKGSVSHSRHTRAWDNSHRDLKATHWGWDHLTKKQPPTPLPTQTSQHPCLYFNSLCRMHAHPETNTFTCKLTCTLIISL